MRFAVYDNMGVAMLRMVWSVLGYALLHFLVLVGSLMVCYGSSMAAFDGHAEAFDRFVMGVHLDVLPSILGQPAFFVAESLGVRGGSFGEWGLFVLNSLLWGAMIAFIRRMFRKFTKRHDV